MPMTLRKGGMKAYTINKWKGRGKPNYYLNEYRVDVL